MRTLIAALAALLCTIPAYAGGGEQGDWELGAYAGQAWLDDYGQSHPDNGGLYGLRVGYFMSDVWSLEGSHQSINSDFDQASRVCDCEGDSCVTRTHREDFDLTATRLNLLANFRPYSKIRPFITAGLGRERTDLDGSSLGINAGGGVRFLLGEHFNIRLDGRYVRTNDESGIQGNTEAAVGLGFLFGGGGAGDGSPSAEPAEPCQECPQGEPGPPGPAGPRGPAGPPGKDATVPSYIPEPGKPVVLEGVEFDHDKDTLQPRSLPILDRVAASLKANPGVEVEIQGHCSDPGTVAYNLDLSDRRAARVRAYLVAHGVAASRLTSKGYGEARPIADNKTAAGQARNRRVELHRAD